MSDDHIRVDFLVLGSGIAGLRAALGLARHGEVLVVTKDQPTESNTGYAQGGVAVAMGSDDATDLHLDDTLKAGAGIVSAPAARVLVEEGPERIRELAAWGARFDREGGQFHFTREGAHSRNRVLHALGDATGWEMVRALLDRAQRTARVSVRSFACSVDLVVAGGAVAGCRFLSESGAVTTVIARATLLATGGAGMVFAETTNPPVATGDGMPWPGARAPPSSTWSSCSSIRPRWPCPGRPGSSSPRPCAAKARTCATGRESASRRSSLPAIKWRGRSPARTGPAGVR